jgi:two-component system, OmpR family, phosphate regulon sensor histidine kinase PhoR
VTVVCELVTDRNGVITKTSPEAASLLAIQERWLVQKPLATFVAGKDRQRFRSLLGDLGADRNAETSGAFVLENREGAELPAEFSAERRDGSLTWRLAVDTERKVTPRPPNRVHATERLFERVLNRLPNGILVFDRDLRVVFVNPSGRRMLDPRSAIRAGDVLPDPWPEFSLRDLAATLFTQRPLAGSHLVDAGDQVLCIEGLPAGQLRTATLLFDDVTERERTRRAERQFVENAAHELRTPLAAILSVVDVLENGAKDDPTTRDRFLAHIRAHSERLVRLATSLLTLARIQTGREQPRLDLVEVRPLLSEVANRLVPAVGVELEVRAPDGIGVLADRDLLYQVLENVATNAIKNTREGLVALEARDLGRVVEIEVADTGAGMERSEVEHAFDRFYRSGPRDQDGFGLGLAIAAEAIRVLGGAIALDSSPRHGTCVRIQLPSARIVS